MPEVRPIDGNDLIRRKDAEKTLEALALQVPESKMRTVAKCVNALHFVPAVDAVPVVRCRECELYRPTACDRLDTVVKPEDFCSYGKRREDNGQNTVGDSP